MTLLETVLGMMVLAVGLLGLMPILSNATAKSVYSDKYVTATYLANERMEHILADRAFLGYDEVENSRYQTEELEDGFTRSTAVTEVNEDDLETEQAGTGYKKVVVTVRWGDQTNQRISITTLLTDI